MPTNSTKKLKVTELDFDLIKQSLKDYLRGQGHFTDYDYEGSGLSVLLDLLAYNTHYNAFYTNMIANEMFLDTATIRSSVVSLAKQLGYTPRSVSSARANVSISFVPSDLGAVERQGASVFVPRGSIFTTEIEDKTYSFVTSSSHTAFPVANTKGGFLQPDETVVPYRASDVEIVQGVFTSVQYVYNSQTKQNFIIPNPDVDTSLVSVLVTDTASGTSGTVYQLAKDYASLGSASNVFFIQETSDEKYEIYFGDGNIGNKPEDGNVIDIVYLVSEGEIGNGAQIFKSDPIKSPFYASGLTGDTTTYTPITTTLSQAAAGADRESLDSIKYLAPRNYESQNRAVTTDDYVVKILADYPQVDAVHCWGGEDNIPPNYGKVYVSIKPKQGYILSDAEKANIKTNILKSRNVITIDPILVDPDFIYMIVDSEVKWDSRLTPISESALLASIKNEVVDWGQDNLERFGSYFRYSSLLNAIDQHNIGILNNDTIIKIRKEILPVVGAIENFTLQFGNPIYRPHVGHEGAVTSTGFDYAGYAGCILRDKDGKLNIYSGGTLVAPEIGTVDYKTGQIDILGFAAESDLVISIIVVPEKKDIVPLNNQLITLKPSDLKISMFDDSSDVHGTLQSTRNQARAVGSSDSGTGIRTGTSDTGFDF
jgi:hypothetical protein